MKLSGKETATLWRLKAKADHKRFWSRWLKIVYKNWPKSNNSKQLKATAFIYLYLWLSQNGGRSSYISSAWMYQELVGCKL